MRPEEHSKAFYSEMDFIRELENRNDNSRDTTLIQLSVGVLAIVATLGKDILAVNQVMSYLMVTCFSLVIFVLVLGFFTTSKLFKSIRSKMVLNVLSEKKFYDDYTSTGWQTVNTIINYTSFALFMLGTIFFTLLLTIYIGGLHG